MFTFKPTMNLIKKLFILFAVLLMTSCATPDLNKEYEAGRLYAYDFAKNDASDFQCFRYSDNLLASLKEREKYTKILINQKKSQMFIEGFYYGYEQTYQDQLVAKCGE